MLGRESTPLKWYSLSSVDMMFWPFSFTIKQQTNLWFVDFTRPLGQVTLNFYVTNLLVTEVMQVFNSWSTLTNWKPFKACKNDNEGLQLFRSDTLLKMVNCFIICLTMPADVYKDLVMKS